jgi:hypothetical protein
MEGDVKIDGAAAEIGREVGPMASIETGPSASCDIVFDGKNAISVEENTSTLLDFSRIVKEVSLKRGGLGFLPRLDAHGDSRRTGYLILNLGR